ncbi:hypothetical protein CAOG_03636 [Capsaspora owczarzaki ATCC 30864]|uniref:hypothetical protein n=1 Tax=Capsaspora owczarzaki (strain ATCC 30864) TaxID=595528 RepID=UPI0001FE2A97|nr:hypothetical protein CAOG_03636 [Capsaspora owczarzaki ATCC 30864]|eukprot:XP_004363364.1 hypothetical protein CAOG_03636 [Capsaspora owczarzaki ATCC 30864]
MLLGDITQKGYDKRRQKVLEPYGGENALKQGTPRPASGFSAAASAAAAASLGGRPSSGANSPLARTGSTGAADTPSKKSIGKSKARAMPSLTDDDDADALTPDTRTATPPPMQHQHSQAQDLRVAALNQSAATGASGRASPLSFSGTPASNSPRPAVPLPAHAPAARTSSANSTQNTPRAATPVLPATQVLPASNIPPMGAFAAAAFAQATAAQHGGRVPAPDPRSGAAQHSQYENEDIYSATDEPVVPRRAESSLNRADLSAIATAVAGNAMRTDSGYLTRTDISNLSRQATSNSLLAASPAAPPPAPPPQPPAMAATPTRHEPGYISRNDVYSARAAVASPVASNLPGSPGAAGANTSSYIARNEVAGLAARNAIAAAVGGQQGHARTNSNSPTPSTSSPANRVVGPGGASLQPQGSRPGALVTPGNLAAGLEQAMARRRATFLPNVDARADYDDPDDSLPPSHPSYGMPVPPTAAATTSTEASTSTSSASPRPPAPPPTSEFSSRIHQLVSALKAPNQPKAKFNAKTKAVRRDPNAPKPLGPVLLPVEGQHEALQPDPLRLTDISATNTLAEVLVWRTQFQAKKVCLSEFDVRGKLAGKITFAGLLDRARRVSDLLFNRLELTVGTRVALVFRPSDVIDFAAALFGCLYCGVVAVPVRPPTKVDDAAATQSGFLLNSCGVKFILTNEVTRRALPKDNSGRIAKMKGWPLVEWVNTEALGKVPAKRVTEPFRLPPAATAIIESAFIASTGEVKPVVVTHKSLLFHLFALMKAAQYTSSSVVLSLLDPQVGVGLHHATLMAVFACFHYVSLPFATFTETPMHLWKNVTKLKATVILCTYPALAFSASRVTDKERRSIKLDSLRQIVIDTERTSPDLSRKFCDKFQVFPAIISTTFYTPESLTAACRSPLSPPVFLHLDLKALGHEVVRVVPAGSKGAVFVQDSGLVLPHTRVCICTVEEQPKLCQEDQQGRLFVTGSAAAQIAAGDGAVQINTQDIRELVQSAQPPIVLNDQITVFATDLLDEERIIVVLETSRPANDQLSTWAQTVFRQVEEASGTSIYTICFCKPGTLPMEGTNVSEFSTKKLYLNGTLNPIMVTINMNGVTNLPSGAAQQHDAARAMADAITGTQLAEIGSQEDSSLAIDDATLTSLDNFQTIAELLRWRALETPQSPMYTVLDEDTGKESQSITCAKLHKMALSIAHFMIDKMQVNAGDAVGILLPHSPAFSAAIFACMYVGAVAVPMRPPHSSSLRYAIPTLRTIAQMSAARTILTNGAIHKLLRSKEAGLEKVTSFPSAFSIDDMSKKKEELTHYYRPPTNEMLAVLEFNISTTGLLAGVRISHDTILSHCRAQKVHHQYHAGAPVVCAIEPYTGVGLIYWTFLNVYACHMNIGVPVDQAVRNAPLFFSTISLFKAKTALASFPVLSVCLDELTSKSAADRLKDIDLSHLVRLLVDCHERPRANLHGLFGAAFVNLGINASVIDSVFGSDVNALIAMRPRASKEPTACYLDLASLRKDRVDLVERGSPNSVCIYSVGKPLSRIHLAIVNPETGRMCTQKQIGEIFVSSPQNNRGYYGLEASLNDATTAETFQARLPGTSNYFAKTGFYGYVYDGEVFVVGDMDESIVVNGLRHYPGDIEQSVEKSSKKIGLDGSAVFLSEGLLVVVVEVGEPAEIMNLLSLVTNTVLSDHGVIAHVIAFVHPGTIPKNARGQKQRVRLRDGFIRNTFQPLHISYNVVE